MSVSFNQNSYYPVNTVQKKPVQNPAAKASFKAAPESEEKEGMSTTAKAVLVTAGLALATLRAIYGYKFCKNFNLEKPLKELIGKADDLTGMDRSELEELEKQMTKALETAKKSGLPDDNRQVDLLKSTLRNVKDERQNLIMIEFDEALRKRFDVPVCDLKHLSQEELTKSLNEAKSELKRHEAALAKYKPLLQNDDYAIDIQNCEKRIKDYTNFIAEAEKTLKNPNVKPVTINPADLESEAIGIWSTYVKSNGSSIENISDLKTANDLLADISEKINQLSTRTDLKLSDLPQQLADIKNVLEKRIVKLSASQNIMLFKNASGQQCKFIPEERNIVIKYKNNNPLSGKLTGEVYPGGAMYKRRIGLDQGCSGVYKAKVGSDFRDCFHPVPEGYTGNFLLLHRLETWRSGKGLGSELIKQAVLDSKQAGFEGRVALDAETINKNRGTPIPFYWKMGFRTADNVKNAEIEKGMQELAKTGKYPDWAPQISQMYLPDDAIQKILASV
ncbi:MAG: hypothetical protein ACI4CY_04410 [Candidatus Gastranaerophilaceae bacterium]